MIEEKDFLMLPVKCVNIHKEVDIMTSNVLISPVAAITVISDNNLHQKRRERDLRDVSNRKTKKRKEAATWAGFADILGDSGSRFSKQA